MFALTPSTAALVLSALSLVSAQSNSESNWKINPNEVEEGTRYSWCTAQTNACSQLCPSVSVNNCDPTTLDFECDCTDASNPDFNQYKDTIPFFVCKQAFTDCIASSPNNQMAQSNCTNTIDKKCPTKSVEDGSSSTSSSSSEATSSSASDSDSSDSTDSSSTPEATSTTASEGAAMPTGFQQMGSGAALVAAGVFAYML